MLLLPTGCVTGSSVGWVVGGVAIRGQSRGGTGRAQSRAVAPHCDATLTTSETLPAYASRSTEFPPMSTSPFRA